MELVVAEFHGAQTAFMARAALGRLQNQLSLLAENIVVVSLSADGRVSLSESLDVTERRTKEIQETFWNTLVHLLVTSDTSKGPDRATALSRIAEIGIDAQCASCFDRRRPSQSSALLALVDSPTMRKQVLGVLNGFHGRIKRCKLKGDDQNEWVRALSAA